MANLTKQQRKAIAHRFALDATDRAALAHEILVAKTTAYIGRLAEIQRSVGVKQTMRLSDIAPMKQFAKDAKKSAVSIVETYANDLQSYVDGLDDGMTVVQAQASVRAWTKQRQTWKAAQIATVESLQARNQADQDVIEKNGISNIVTARLYPLLAEEERCSEIIGRGWMTYNDIDFSIPVHPGCQHGLEYEKPFATMLDGKPQVWIGDTFDVEGEAGAVG